MKEKVLHLVRKKTQLYASFISNQINKLNEFEPVITFRNNIIRENISEIAEIDLQKIKYLDLSYKETLLEKILYKTIKQLSNGQIKNISNFIEKENIAICHFHYGTDCGIYYPLLKHLKIPSIVSFYGYDCSSFLDYLFGFGRYYLRKRVFANISAVLAMSLDMKADLLNAGCPENKIIVHYHGVDCERFYHKHDYSIHEKVKILILAGLVPQKGHIFLLQSLCKVIKDGLKKVHLRIVGNGELENNLKRFIQKRGLSNYVTFVGAIKYASSEMIKEYQDADIFIHPSVIAKNGDKEGIPGTLIEAMSAGVPVISTYHAGIPYIIKNNETGLLVPEWDVAALSDAIITLYENPKMRKQLGEAGQRIALNELNIIKKEKELERIYNTLLK